MAVPSARTHPKSTLGFFFFFSQGHWISVLDSLLVFFFVYVLFVVMLAKSDTPVCPCGMVSHIFVNAALSSYHGVRWLCVMAVQFGLRLVFTRLNVAFSVHSRWELVLTLIWWLICDDRWGKNALKFFIYYVNVFFLFLYYSSGVRHYENISVSQKKRSLGAVLKS